MSDTVFRYSGLGLNVNDYTLELTCLDEDERGFSGRIVFALPHCLVEVHNYFLGYDVWHFAQEIKAMRDGKGPRASLLSFDAEIQLLVALSPRLTGAIGIKLLCGEDFKSDCFVKECKRDSRKRPRLILDSGFIELDQSYLETLLRDIHAFLAAARFSRQHPCIGSGKE